jgi:hypothetical protein
LGFVVFPDVPCPSVKTAEHYKVNLTLLHVPEETLKLWTLQDGLPCGNPQINIFHPVGVRFPEGRQLGIYRKPVQGLFFGTDLNTSVQSHSHINHPLFISIGEFRQERPFYRSIMAVSFKHGGDTT